jgi:hypothetical protein
MEKKCEICGEIDLNNFYPQRKNKCKKCILSKENVRYQKMDENEKKQYSQKQREWRSNNIIKYRVESAKHRAIRKGISFEINEDIILQKLKEQNGLCYISKKPLLLKENDWYGVSLDRLDSNLGYTIENTILVTKFVNSSKNELSLDEYKKLLKEVCDNIL